MTKEGWRRRDLVGGYQRFHRGPVGGDDYIHGCPFEHLGNEQLTSPHQNLELILAVGILGSFQNLSEGGGGPHEHFSRS